MSTARQTSDAIADQVRFVDGFDGLSAISEPDCSAVMWRRRPLPAFQEWIDHSDPDHLPQTRIVVRPERLRDAVDHVCGTSGLADSPERSRLQDDIAALGIAFAGLMAAPFVRLRLDVVRTNACRKFHVDAVTARLVCTYRGTGTQYGICSDGNDPARICTTPTGSPIVLRGSLWPNDPVSALRHRSPPIEGTGETRLLLVFDPVMD